MTEKEKAIQKVADLSAFVHIGFVLILKGRIIEYMQIRKTGSNAT